MSEVIEYKCPACGGKLEFDSTSQKMKCPFCESEFEVDSIKGIFIFVPPLKESLI